MEADKTMEDGNILIVHEQKVIKIGSPTLLILLIILILALTSCFNAGEKYVNKKGNLPHHNK